jgi:hypothetical protein
MKTIDVESFLVILLVLMALVEPLVFVKLNRIDNGFFSRTRLYDSDIIGREQVIPDENQREAITSLTNPSIMVTLS